MRITWKNIVMLWRNFRKYKNDNLNSDELSYYTEIQVRVTKKLADIQ